MQLRMPNHTASAGMASTVTPLITRPQTFSMMPRLRLPLLPHDHTNPETRMNVQQIDCCQMCTAGREYQDGSRP